MEQLGKGALPVHMDALKDQAAFKISMVTLNMLVGLVFLSSVIVPAGKDGGLISSFGDLLNDHAV